MDSKRFNDAWISLVSAIDDWVNEYPELIRHPQQFSEHAANVIFEEVLGLDRDGDGIWKSEVR